MESKQKLLLGNKTIHTVVANTNANAVSRPADRDFSITVLVAISLVASLSISLAISVSPVVELINSIGTAGIVVAVLSILQVLISGILILNLLIS
ncbi:hypothetical protein ACG2F4_15215 [Halalkalibaculum sp. DA3122]